MLLGGSDVEVRNGRALDVAVCIRDQKRPAT